MSKGKYKGGSPAVSYGQSCNHDAKSVLQVGDLEYWAADSWGTKKTPNGILLVSLKNDAIAVAPKKVVSSKIKGVDSKLNKYASGKSYSRLPDISIDWPDMSAPPVSNGFWQAIYDVAKQQGKKGVCFYCIGGHGRTGTALVCTLVEVCGMEPKEALDMVRDAHCNKAVETSSQKKYIKALAEHYGLSTEGFETEPPTMGYTKTSTMAKCDGCGVWKHAPPCPDCKALLCDPCYYGKTGKGGHASDCTKNKKYGGPSGDDADEEEEGEYGTAWSYFGNNCYNCKTNSGVIINCEDCGRWLCMTCDVEPNAHTKGCQMEVEL